MHRGNIYIFRTLKQKYFVNLLMFMWSIQLHNQAHLLTCTFVIDITIWATGRLFVCFNYMFSRCSVAAVNHANKSVSMSSRHGRPHPHTWIVNCSVINPLPLSQLWNLTPSSPVNTKRLRPHLECSQPILWHGVVFLLALGRCLII